MVPMPTDLYTNGLEVFTEPLQEDESFEPMCASAGVKVPGDDPVTYTIVIGSTIRGKVTHNINSRVDVLWIRCQGLRLQLGQ